MFEKENKTYVCLKSLLLFNLSVRIITCMVTRLTISSTDYQKFFIRSYLLYGDGFGFVIHPVKLVYVLFKGLPNIICQFFCLGWFEFVLKIMFNVD